MVSASSMVDTTTLYISSHSKVESRTIQNHRKFVLETPFPFVSPWSVIDQPGHRRTEQSAPSPAAINPSIRPWSDLQDTKRDHRGETTADDVAQSSRSLLAKS